MGFSWCSCHYELCFICRIRFVEYFYTFIYPKLPPVLWQIRCMIFLSEMTWRKHFTGWQMCTLFLCAFINSYMCFFFFLCSNWTEDGGQEQVSGCPHHPPVMRGTVSIMFSVWVLNSVNAAAVHIFMSDVTWINQSRQTCTVSPVQELYPCF